MNNSHDEKAFLEHMWQIKNELSADLKIDSNFWVTLDYMIYLSSSLLKMKKNLAEKHIHKFLRPLFEKNYSDIHNLYRKIPEDRYPNTQKDAKTFHHIVSHTINLIDKRHSHFIPSYLFILSIENMTVLSPRLEMCVEPAMLARKNFPLLMSRHISVDFSSSLQSVIDFLLWYKAAAPILTERDTSQAKKYFLKKIKSAAGEEFSQTKSTDSSLFKLISELRHVISASLVSEKLFDIMNKTNYISEGEHLPAEDFLMEISDIFISRKTDMDSKSIAFRDISLVLSILKKMETAMNSSSKTMMAEAVYTASALTSFIKNVSIHMTDISTGLYLRQFTELSDFISRLSSMSICAPEIGGITTAIQSKLEKELSRLKTTGCKVSEDHVNLFAEKAEKLYARKN